MPLACRIYELDPPLPLEEIGQRISSLRTGEYSMATISQSPSTIRGILEEHSTIKVGGTLVTLTEPIRFEYFKYRSRTLLIVLAGRNRAARAARAMAEALGAEAVGVFIPPERLEMLYAEGDGVVRMIVFSMVRSPGIRIITLQGEDVLNSDFYRDTKRVGEAKYVVFRTREGLLMGVGTSGVVTCFSRMSDEEFLEYVEENIVPLTQAAEKADPGSDIF